MSGSGRPQDADFACDESDDRIVISGPGLAVVFERASDRWTHRVQLGGSGNVEIARSVEIDAERASSTRVTSPVYQEVHHHELTGHPGRCLLLTGRSFEHHFSAAVSLRFDFDRPGSLIADLDVADRCRAPVESLAATYLVKLSGSAVAGADRTTIAWHVSGEAEGRLEFVVDPPAALALAEAGRLAARVQALAALEPGGFTHRFRYRWRWTSVSGTTA